MKLNPPPDDKALVMLDALVARASDNPRALAVLGQMLLSRGEDERARSLASQARTLAPDDGEIAILTAEILSAGVPLWHYLLVRDEVRNAAFDAALRQAVRSGMRVLDIGSGSGLLALMAARAGASEVVSCEMNPAVAEVARKIVADNGYAGRIRIVGKHSADLDLQSDLGGPVDLLVSEIISDDMLGEGVLPSIEQAMRLLKPGAPVIPARGSVRVALGNYRDPVKRRMATVDGFDLSSFNELAPKSFRVKWRDRNFTPLSEVADLFTFDFASGGPFPGDRATVLLTAQSDSVNGVAQWIHLKMDDVGEYENDPANEFNSCWTVLFYPFATDLRYDAGERVKIVGAHDRLHLRIWTEKYEG